MNIRRITSPGKIPAVLVFLTLLTGCTQPQTQTTGSSATPPATSQTTQAATTTTAATATQAATQQTIVPEISQEDMINLMLDMEDQFKLQNVIATQSGATMDIRFKGPTISGDQLYAGLAQIFSWLNEKVPSQITSINLVFMIQNVESLVIAVNRDDIQNWKAGKMDNTAFIKTFKKTSLL